MIEIVGVKFRRNCKMYYFSPNGLQLKKGENIIVDTVRGNEFATVILDNKQVDEKEISGELKKVIRIATNEDKKQNEENQQIEKEATKFFKEQVKEFELDMKLISCEYIFDRSKLLFYFTAEDRIDFRNFVKVIAAQYKTRIELRQIGARDEVKMLGENGVCGRGLCCNSFLNEFEPVSIKMAKDQGLSLNPTKISGMCGKLMCCLKFEQNVYEDKLKSFPKVGQKVKTPDGEGTVLQIAVLQDKLKIKFNRPNEDIAYKTYDISEIEFKPKKNAEQNNNEE
ncbi:MAG: stage 0 sporulation protein [Clostridiales bacterium]|nr:stage 0 sporulation protein [Clostridiales bacterium]